MKTKRTDPVITLSNETSDVSYALEDIEEILDAKVNFIGTVPVKLQRKLIAKSRRLSKAITRVYDAVYAAQEAAETLSETLDKLELS